MSPKNKILAGWIAFAFVIFHLSALIIYAAPPKLIPSEAKGVVSPYVEPLFNQSWSMFAPCPFVKGKVKARYVFGKDTTDWVYPTENDVKYHTYLRASHHGDILILEANLVNWAYYDMQEYGLSYGDSIPENIEQEYRYIRSSNILRRFVRRSAESIFGKSPDAAIAKFEFTHVKTHESGEFQYPIYHYTKR